MAKILTASQKQAIAKRRKLLQQQGPLSRTTVKATPEESEKVRNAAKASFKTVFDRILEQHPDIGADSTATISKLVEVALFDKFDCVNDEYRAKFRQLLAALKDADSHFALDILCKKLPITVFVSMSKDDLASEKQRLKDEKIKQELIREKVVEEGPKTINDVKDGRDRERWGVSKSAAAIDDE